MNQPQFTDLKGLLEYTMNIGKQMFNVVGLPEPKYEIDEYEGPDSPMLIIDDMFMISFGLEERETLWGKQDFPCFVLEIATHDPGGYWEPPSTDYAEVMRDASAYSIWKKVIHIIVDDQLDNWGMEQESIQAAKEAEEMYQQMEADLATNDPRNGG